MIEVPVRGQPASSAPRPKPNLVQRLVRWRMRHRQAIEAWLIMGPLLFYFSLFFLIPFGATFALSFTKWAGMGPAPMWVGLDNYRRWLTNSHYLQAFLNTILFAVSILFLQTALA